MHRVRASEHVWQWERAVITLGAQAGKPAAEMEQRHLRPSLFCLSAAAWLAMASCGEPELPELGECAVDCLEEEDEERFEPPPATPALSQPSWNKQPFALLTLSGTTGAERVVVEEREGRFTPMSVQVDADHGFCVDRFLKAPGTYVLDVYSHALDGQRSRTAATVEVEYDPEAEAPEGAVNCFNLDPAQCVPNEICNDGADNDCDGKADASDADCAGAPVPGTCTDDDLEPNNTTPLPVEASGGATYKDLSLCGGDKDLFSIRLAPGESVEVIAEYLETPQGGLKLYLLNPSSGGQQVAEATPVDGGFILNYTRPATDDGPAGPYTIVFDAEGQGVSSYEIYIKTSAK